jgi:hypothetical protein
MIIAAKKNTCGLAAPVVLTLAFLAGCHSSSAPPAPVPTPQSTDPITLTGAISDGPVIGGSLFGFGADAITDALAAAATASDRAGALAAAGPLFQIARDVDGDEFFATEIDASLARSIVFLVFDSGESEDSEFGDTPPNMESILRLGVAGSAQRINVSPHTTIIAQLVRADLDPDGDGTPIDANAVDVILQAAELDVLDALGENDLGQPLFAGESPLSTQAIDVLHEASSLVGLWIRTLAALEGMEPGDVLAALAADLADGSLDGAIADGFDPTLSAPAVAMAAFLDSTDDDGYQAMGVGPCSSSAVLLRRACSIDRIDDRLEGRAFCADLADADQRMECLENLEDELADAVEECGDVFDARLDVCALIGDAAHEPAFGPAFSPNFVDPFEIGASVTPNPYFPLVVGNSWTYEGSFYDEDEEEIVNETVVVTVLDRVKLIDGIPCLVVNDVVIGDNGTKEDTNDWLAQDTDGNVWYCGEISRDFELFEGDSPEEFELVHTEGSWKHGRDGAEAGILLPAQPEIGTLIRQEVLYGEAEDVIEIESLTGTETAPGASCTGNCLVTLDYSPLDPGAAENKYYAPGIGMIVEVDLESGDRLELIDFTAL